MDAVQREGREAQLAVMGRKGLAYFRFHEQPVAFPIADADENLPFRRLDEVVEQIGERFAAAELDAVEIVSTRWKSRAVQEVRIVPFLPFLPSVAAAVIGSGPTVPTEGSSGKPLYLVERISRACWQYSCRSW